MGGSALVKVDDGEFAAGDPTRPDFTAGDINGRSYYNKGYEDPGIEAIFFSDWLFRKLDCLTQPPYTTVAYERLSLSSPRGPSPAGLTKPFDSCSFFTRSAGHQVRPTPQVSSAARPRPEDNRFMC